MPSKPTSARVPIEVVPGHFALTDIEVLVNTGGRARRVDNIAQSRAGLMVEGVGDVDMCQHVGAFAKHRYGVVAEIERVRGAIEEIHVPGIHRADDVDGRLQGLDQSSGCGSTCRLTPSRSRIGTSSSIDRHQASSQASIIEPVWQL